MIPVTGQEIDPATGVRHTGEREDFPPEEPKDRRGSESPSPRRPWTRMLPWALFVVALAAAVVFAALWQGARGGDRRRAEVASTATRFLSALTNFSGATIEADVAEIRSFAVGDFADQVETFFDRDARDALRSAGAKSEGRIRSIFVESLSGESAEVFGVVDESVTNASTPAPRTEVLRVAIAMIETTSGWRIQRVDILQSPTQAPFGTQP